MEQENEQVTRAPAHQRAYEQLRDMVLFGELAPGEAVTIEGLIETLALGMTPVREAIRRLCAEGALQMSRNRRVSVPRLTLRDLEDLCLARIAIETELARQAVGSADDALLSGLRRCDMRLDAAVVRRDVGAYLRANHAFHFRLYACAGSPVLETLAASLWLRVSPSLRVVCLGPEGAALPDHHKPMLAALSHGDGPALAAALQADIRQGIENIRAGLDGGHL